MHGIDGSPRLLSPRREGVEGQEACINSQNLHHDYLAPSLPRACWMNARPPALARAQSWQRSAQSRWSWDRIHDRKDLSDAYTPAASFLRR